MDSPRATRRRCRITRVQQPADVVEACIVAAIATALQPPALIDLCTVIGLADVPQEHIELALDRLERQGMIEHYVSTTPLRYSDGRLAVMSYTVYRLGPKAVLDA